MAKRSINGEHVRDLYGKGLSIRQVAEVLGVSMAGIRHRLKTDGVPRRSNSDAKRLRIESDPDYAKSLVLQAKSLPKTTEESARKRLVTMRDRYTSDEVADWASRGGLAAAEGGAWNKGLTKDTDERVAAQAQALIGHAPNKGSGRGKGGYRDDIQMYVRSTWEADFVRVLNVLGLDFEYEPKCFDLGGDSYWPDFWIPQFQLWVEVSGWVSPQKACRLELFRTRYPQENLFHLDKGVYSGLASMFRHKIPNWEGKPRGEGSCVPLIKLIAA